MSKLPGKMTRKQHWIPQFYLRYFANSAGQLHAYGRSDDRFFPAKTESLCSKRDLYEVEYSDPDDDSDSRFYAQNFIERRLSEEESEISASYSQFLQCCKDEVFEGDAFRQGQEVACRLASNLIVRHPESMFSDRSRAREESILLQENDILSGKDKVLLDWSGWNGDHEALAELSITATMLFSEDDSVPINRIYKAFFEKRFCVLEAPIGSSFITTSMPMFIKGPEDDSYDFDCAYMPLSCDYAALFTSDASLKIFHRLDFVHTELMNRLLLLNSEHWDFAMSKGSGPLEHAVRDWKCSIV